MDLASILQIAHAHLLALQCKYSDVLALLWRGLPSTNDLTHTTPESDPMDRDAASRALLQQRWHALAGLVWPQCSVQQSDKTQR